MSRRERIQRLVAEGRLTAEEARVLLEALPTFDPLEGAGVTEPPPAPNPSPSQRESSIQSFQPLFVFIQEA